MDLVDYVMGVHESGIYLNGFPAKLQVPKALVESWHDIYNQGERLGCEYGQSLKLDRGTGKFTTSDFVQGTDISCDVPRSRSTWEFGDMHSHPTMSIGHVKGFSAHSVEDWRVFAHHLAKPVFIRFVATGDMLYAVAYCSTCSRYNSGSLDDKITEQTRYQTELFEASNPDKYAGLSEDEILHLDDLKMKVRIIQLKMQTPGFGQALMRKSQEYNTALANLMNFGFYEGNRKKRELRLVGGAQG